MHPCGRRPLSFQARQLQRGRARPRQEDGGLLHLKRIATVVVNWGRVVEDRRGQLRSRQGPRPPGTGSSRRHAGERLGRLPRNLNLQFEGKDMSDMWGWSPGWSGAMLGCCCPWKGWENLAAEAWSNGVLFLLLHCDAVLHILHIRSGREGASLVPPTPVADF